MSDRRQGVRCHDHAGDFTVRLEPHGDRGRYDYVLEFADRTEARRDADGAEIDLWLEIVRLRATLGEIAFIGTGRVVELALQAYPHALEDRRLSVGEAIRDV